LSGAVHEPEDGGDFLACHDHGDVHLLGGAYGIDATLHDLITDALVEEHPGIHGLVLGRGRDVSLHRQVGQEGLDLRFGGEEVGAGPHPVETGEPFAPFHIGALGMIGVVVQTEYLAYFIEQFRGLTSSRVRHTRVPSWRPGIVDNRHRADCPKSRPISHYQGKMTC
jgi:hypothetical protein